MSDITLPNDATAFALAGLADPDLLAENIYSPNTTPDSYDVINGFLDRDNADGVTAGSAVWTPGKHSFIKGELTRYADVGSTRDARYTRDMFTTSTTSAQRHIIPGTAQELYVPWATGEILVTWNVSYATSDTATDGTLAFLKKAPSDNVWVQPTSYSVAIRRYGPGTTAPSFRTWNSCWVTVDAEVGSWKFALAVQRQGASSANSEVQIKFRSIRAMLM